MASAHDDPMVIDVWADVVCPFCYLGHAALDRAIEDFAHGDAVDVRYRSFQLAPDLPEDTSMPVAEYLASKGMAPGEHTDEEARMLQTLHDQAHHALVARRAHQERVASQGRVVGADEVGFTPAAEPAPQPGPAPEGLDEPAEAATDGPADHSPATDATEAEAASAGDPPDEVPEQEPSQVIDRVPARDLEPGAWVRVDIDGDEFDAEVLDVSEESSDDTVALDYHTPDGEIGGIELDADELIARVHRPESSG